MSGATAVAAAKAKQLLNAEEESTKYKDEELQNDWEFKFVRSVTGAFKKPEKFQIVIENESRHGWKLVEKFDDNRLRFKRKNTNSVINTDPTDDPYKTYYGIGPLAFFLIIFFGTLFGIGLLTGLLLLFVQ